MKNVSTRSFLSLIQSVGPSAATNIRCASLSFLHCYFESLTTSYSLIGTTTSVLSLTPSFLAAVVNETTVGLQDTPLLVFSIDY